MTRTIVWCGALALGLHAAAGLAQVPQAPPSAGDAAAGWRAVVQCAAIGSAEQRHACLDDALRRAGVLSAEREAQARRDSFGREVEPKSARSAASAPPPVAPPTASPTAPPTAAPAAPPGAPEARPGSPTASAAPPRPQPAEPDRLRTTVRSANLAGNRMLLVVTAEGAAWTQTESAEFHVLPRPGDAFEIQRGRLGGYRCTFGQSSVYRCRRLD